jgi:hypothetical protein
MLGSAIGIAVSGSIINSFLKSRLGSVLSSSQLGQLLQDVSIVTTFDENIRHIVEHTFADAYNIIFKILIGVVAVQFASVFLIWKRPQLVLKH